ncbi:MAG: hypothetical protein IT269_03055, partial [Saprospiraceae bacterium]|nr:hypothetical protein [Saprospiraceae bacterium]
MKNVFILLIINIFATYCAAQNSPGMANIAAARLELKRSILIDDIAGAGLWMDSLSKMERETYTTIVWDEQWLLYYWSGTYGNLLEEVAGYDVALRDMQSARIAPPDDSLFTLMDSIVLERRFDYYQQIQ